LSALFPIMIRMGRWRAGGIGAFAHPASLLRGRPGEGRDP
jgi:hypothetical protein